MIHQNNEEEVIQTFRSSLKKYVMYVAPRSLNSMVSLLRDLKQDEVASEFIDLYIDTHSSDPAFFDLSRNSFFTDTPDQELARKFSEKLVSFQTDRTIESVLADISEQHRWGEADEAVLASATSDDFHRIFKAARGKSLHSYVEASLMLERGGDPTDRQKAITAKAKQALLQIGSESLLNKVRVIRHGVYRDDKTC
jgi:hypothetical protein